MLAVPDYFSKADEKWAKNFILGTLKNPETLREKSRFSLFKNNKYFVFGVACMADDLLGLDQPLDTSRTRDFKKRPIYLFVGYVVELKTLTKKHHLPSYTDLHYETFQGLYDFVTDRWNIEDYERHRQTPIRSVPRLTKQPELVNYRKQTNTHQSKIAGIELSQILIEDNMVMVWPDSEGSKIWDFISQGVCNQLQTKEEVSLCLNLPNQSEASKTPFDYTSITTNLTRFKKILRVHENFSAATNLECSSVNSKHSPATKKTSESLSQAKFSSSLDQRAQPNQLESYSPEENLRRIKMILSRLLANKPFYLGNIPFNSSDLSEKLERIEGEIRQHNLPLEIPELQKHNLQKLRICLERMDHCFLNINRYDNLNNCDFTAVSEIENSGPQDVPMITYNVSKGTPPQQWF